MNFQGSQTLAMSLQSTWNFLANVSNVISCVPGFQRLDQVAADEWRAVIGISVGFVRATFPVKITCPLMEEQKHITFHATGQASGSSVDMSGDVEIVAIGNDETRLDWKTTVNVAGLLARIPTGILASTMERSSNVFFAVLTRRMTSCSEKNGQRTTWSPVIPGIPVLASGQTTATAATMPIPATAASLASDLFMWRWPWYLIASLAAVGIALLPDSGSPLAVYGLLILALLALLIMLAERTPEALIAPAILVVLAIVRFSADVSISLLASSLLCLLIFASRFLWEIVTPRRHLFSPAWFPAFLALGGQLLVVCIALANGSPVSPTSLLIYTEATTLLIFTLLVFWLGLLLPDRPALSHWCYYCAGFLIGLCITWYLLALPAVHSQPDSYEFFTIAPAISLSVIAPFLIHEKTLPHARQIGQTTAFIAAVVLLFPAAIAGFDQAGHSANLIPIELLLFEAFALFLLGILTRMQIFTYGGVTVVVLGAFRAFIVFIQGNATADQKNLIMVSIIFYAIVLVAASIFSVSRDRRKTRQQA